jgi:hypothetical protein
MKLCIWIVASILSLSQTVSAQATTSPAERLKNQMEPNVMAMIGVEGIGVGGCNPSSGDLATIDDLGLGRFLECVVIYTDGHRSIVALRRLYPVGTRINGVFVATQVTGRVGPYPRMTGGN